MQTDLYPLLFQPIYRDDLWGGNRIVRRFGRTGAPERCAESWELAAHPDGASVVQNGPLAGQDLGGLVRTFGEALCGFLNESERFPLLLKLIDARERLSVQVHPGEESARRYGGDPKTEAWYLLEALPGSVVYSGWNPGCGPRKFQDAVAAQQVPGLLRTLPAQPGKTLYMPGGTVHAIGEGCLLLEVQQNSNTTYRLYDWGRVGEDGKPRPLHLHRALEVLDWKAPAMEFLSPVPVPASAAGNQRQRLLRSDFFQLHRTVLAEPEDVILDGSTFHALFVAEGEAGIAWESGEPEPLRLECGRTCLVPASQRAYRLIPSNPAECVVLTVSL